MLMVIGLMPQEKTVCPCLFQDAVALPGAFAYGESDCAVLPPGMDGRDDIRQTAVRKPAVLPALEYKRAEPEFIAVLTAGQDLIRREAVPLGIGVALSDPAVQTVIAAVIGELDQAAYVDVMSVMADAGFPCPLKEVFRCLFIAPADQFCPFLTGEGTSVLEPVDELCDPAGAFVRIYSGIQTARAHMFFP